MNSIRVPNGVIDLLNEAKDKWCTSDVAVKCQECIEDCIRNACVQTSKPLREVKTFVIRRDFKVNFVYSAIDNNILAEFERLERDDYSCFNFIRYEYEYKYGNSVKDLNEDAKDQIKDISSKTFGGYSTPKTTIFVALVFRTEIKYFSLYSTPLKVIPYNNSHADPRILEILKAAIVRLNTELEDADKGLYSFFRRWSPF